MEYDATFPGDPEVFIYVLAVEEFMHEICDCLLHLFIQNHIIPACFLDLFV